MNRSQSEYCNVGSKTYLTNHPAKKFVFDFMRVLIIDNLCLTPASKQTPLIDLLLEVELEFFLSGRVGKGHGGAGGLLSYMLKFIINFQIRLLSSGVPRA